MLNDIESIDRGDCRTHFNFSDYVKTLQRIDDENNIVQENNKCTHFLRYAQEALLTHLSQ